MLARDGHHLSLNESNLNSHAAISGQSSVASYLLDQTTPQGKPVFANLASKFICPFCKDVLREAVQSECGHRYCKNCADAHFSEERRTKCPFNEEDCIELVIREIHRDTSVRKEVRLLLVCCTFKNAGCSMTIPWKDLLDHEQTCEYRKVVCIYQSFGCKENVTLKFIDKHTANCQYQPVNCRYCNTKIARINIKDHERNECRKAPMSCQYNCHFGELPREEMEMHMTQCPLKPKDCFYKQMGCEFKGSENDMIHHNKEFFENHLELMTVFVAKMELDVLRVHREVQSVSTERESYRHDIENFKRECEEIKKEEEGLKSGIKDTTMKVVANTERIINLERKTEELASNSVVENQKRTTKYLKDTLEKLTEKITRIENDGHRGGYTPNSSADFSRIPADMIDQMKQQDRQITIEDIRMAELDLRFQILETANYDGTLLWKIRDYCRRKQEAMSGRTLSLFSQPFYSGQYGYKMCARVYLHGDGSGKGTHLSLYFVVMRGEYDALLEWPFRKRITLAVLDQERRGRNVMETFDPDITSESYKRPTSEMNIASGCPQLISHRDLETTTYVKDDTIFLKITITEPSENRTL